MAHLPVFFLCVCDTVDCTALWFRARGDWFRVKGWLLGGTGRERDLACFEG